MDKKFTMLIVDDEEINRSILRGIFDLDYNIYEAKNGQEALDIVKEEERIDVMLLDIVMPQMDGFTVLEKLNGIDKSREMAIIVDTQYQDVEYEIRALEYGVDDFINKPYNPRVVRQRVANAVQRYVYSRHIAEETYKRLTVSRQRDSLTGLYNRETFYLRTRDYILTHPGESLVVGSWDVDNFRMVNEMYGEAEGDKAIIALAKQLAAIMGKNGTFGRGDADGMLFCTTETYLEEMLPEIEDVLEGKGEWNTIGSAMKLHLGLYRIEDSKMSVGFMFDRADMAKKLIKEDYVKRYNYYEEKFKDTMLLEQELIGDVEKALKEGQFHILIQPIVDTGTGKTVSGEALIRWNHPTRGYISPGVFIPIFEKSRVVDKLDFYVFEKVCAFQKEQKEKGNPMVPISVNLSRVDFDRKDLVKKIEGIAEKYEVERSYLKLEVTESAYEEKTKKIFDTIEKFRKQGYKILMDDFGSGYSSLNMLKDCNVDILKIDMKFINDLETSERANNILFAIFQMAKILKMETVAEGVETRAQLELLTSMGCDNVQGYYFSRPITTEEFRMRLLDEASMEDNLLIRNFKRTILVVDDQDMDREIMCTMIGDNYNIIEAHNGEEALELLKRHFKEISLVISDISMPKMTGLELLSRMNSIIYLEEMPVIMVTAYGERENEEKALSLGALEIITKPYDAALVHKRVENILKISETEEKIKRLQSLWEDSVGR